MVDDEAVVSQLLSYNQINSSQLAKMKHEKEYS